ncbi:hypothetical protein B9T19_03705 [Ignatzschineria sp. F8392]|uniref:hypothetical protein n=1 Tax=Ignatzschineria sp. F8392 TaxID=1980117 RepID=UPI000B99D2B1|nr:hypothetical protein [Ignatzschineria sp. F8392]OYQ81777.1 hypothetical protein B9T19_03705 [Ignatzschineria sp. F8392]
MSEIYSLDLSYAIKYETDQYIPLNEIIKALSSLEVLLSKSDKIVSELINIDISGQELYITRLQSGSLWEDILVKLIFKDQESLDKAIEKLRDSKMREYILGAILGGALLYGYTLLTSNNQASNVVSDTNQSNIIQDSDNSNIFNFHGDVIDEETREIINEVIQESFAKDPASVAKQTINFFEPARKDPEAKISMGGDTELPSVISKEVINTVPEKYKKPDNKDVKELDDVKISFRAKDLDSNKAGWAGVIESVGDFGDSGIDLDDIGDGRLKVELDPLLDPDDIFEQDYIYANISLERKYDQASNKLRPTRIIIRSILDK